MQNVSYQRILQSCRHAIIEEGSATAEPPAFKEFEPTRIITEVRQFQVWIKETTVQAEFQMFYQMGRAMNINQTKRQQRQHTDALNLKSREKTTASRVYLLF